MEKKKFFKNNTQLYDADSYLDFLITMKRVTNFADKVNFNWYKLGAVCE